MNQVLLNTNKYLSIHKNHDKNVTRDHHFSPVEFLYKEQFMDKTFENLKSHLEIVKPYELDSKNQLSKVIVPKSILMVSDDFYPAATGVGIHIQSMAKELVKKGYKVCVITSRRKGQNKEEMYEGIKVYRVFSIKIAGFYQAIAFQKEITQILQANKIEIVHHHYLSFLLEKVHAAAKSLNIPQVYTYHMSPEHLTQPLFMKPFASYISNKLVSYCNKFEYIISPSNRLVDEIKKSGVNKPVQFISNPIGLNSSEATKPVMKQAPFQILFVGRLAPEKNIPLLIKAVKSLIAQGKKVHLWVIGEGGQRNYLEKLANELGVKNEVSFLGQKTHSELANYYVSCDVFVLPSTLETQGLVAMEAMKFAKPVIVTKDIVSAKELVDDEQNGFIVDSQDPNELASKLNLLLNSEELREQMSKASFEKSKTFSSAHIVSITTGIYQLVSNSNVSKV